MTVYSNSISGTLAPGDSERFVVETRNHDAVRATVSADGQPYEVDIQTGSELNFPTYSSVLPLGAEEFTDTDEHVLASDIAEDAVYVEVTNTGNADITLDGSINRHSEGADATVTSFLTDGTENTGLAYRDGELVTDSDKAFIRALTGGLVSSPITSLDSGNLAVQGGSLTADVNTNPDRDDDTRLHFGTDDDYFIEYDSTAGELQFGSADIDGGGTEGVLFTVDDASRVADFLGGVGLLDNRVRFGAGENFWMQYDSGAGEFQFGSADIDGGGTEGVLFSSDDASRITDFLGAIDMGGNLVQNLGEPTGPNEAARKGYVDGVAQGLNLKEEVRAATDGANVDLTSATDPNPIDGVTLTDGQRVLLKDQTDGTENGIYVATTATDPTTWTRAPDLDEDAEASTGVFVFVDNGTVNGNKSFVITTNDPITLGTTSITWSVFTTAGELLAGTNITKTGQTFNVSPQGEGSGLDADLYRGTDLDNALLAESASGTVKAGNANIFADASLADGQSLEIYSATLATEVLGAVPTGVDLVIATFDGAGGSTLQTTALTGDGSTVFVGESNTPLASYTNNSGGGQTVGVLVDNGNFNAGSGADQDVQTSANGRVV